MRYKTLHKEHYITRGDIEENMAAPIITDTEGYVVAAAKRFDWAVGKAWDEVKDYLESKHYRVDKARC